MLTILRKQTAIFLALLLLLAANGAAQKKGKGKDKPDSAPTGTPVLWQKANASSLDLYNGPGGDSMKPDLTNITFIERDTKGHNKKYRIKDGQGRVWVAKLGSEARSETAAVRLLYGLGYVTEINYLVPEITIPTVGTYKNVRLEA